MPEEKPKETPQDLIQAAKQLPPTEVFSLRPRNFEEAYRFANLIAESDMIPKEFQKKPANVLVAVQLGMELGVAPMQALQNIYVVNGRPAVYGDLLPAIVLQSGLLEEWHEEGDEKTASCTVKRKGHPPITRTFTLVEAERAKLVERNPIYKSYPKRMLQMRARAYAFRDMFPDVMKGVAVREEQEDMALDVTPPPPQMKIPQPTTAPTSSTAATSPALARMEWVSTASLDALNSGDPEVNVALKDLALLTQQEQAAVVRAIADRVSLLTKLQTKKET